MLVIHWSRQNRSGKILSNGIRATSVGFMTQEARLFRGVYVYPFSPNRMLMGNWRRNLKTWRKTRMGNFNGFVFRLAHEDFPLFAGYWMMRHFDPEEWMVNSMEELGARFGEFFSGEIINKVNEHGFHYNWADFEIIIPRHIAPDRIIRIIKDREPGARSIGCEP